MLEQIAHEDPAFLREATARKAKNKYWFFLRVVLDYRWMDPWFHGEEIVRFLDDCYEQNADALVEVFRDAGKSGLVTQPRPAWIMARDPLSLNLIGNAAEDKAKTMARASATIITENPLYKTLFPDVVPRDKWGDDGYFLKPLDLAESEWADRIDPNLKGFGVGGNVTGAHPNGVAIVDDLINLKTHKSPAHLLAAEDFFREIVNCATLSCQIICVCTRWTYYDYAGKLETGEIETKRGKMRLLKLGVTRKVKHEGKTKEVLSWPRTTYYDQTNKAIEVGWDWKMIESVKRSQKDLWPALYYNEPVLSKDVQFRIDFIKTFPSEYAKPFTTGPVAKVAIEVEAQQAALLDSFRNEMRRERRKLPLYQVTTKREEKISRILAALQAPIAEGRFNMRLDLLIRDDNIGEEMRTFPKGAHDDCLDSCAYMVMSCINDPDEEFPRVHIACDPAFSEERWSDYSTIATGCKYMGEIWLLDLLRFQTKHSDVIIKQVFNTFDKYDRLAFKNETPKKKPNFSTSNSQRRGSRGRSRSSGNSFEVDLELHNRNKGDE